MSEYLDIGALWRVAVLSVAFGVGMVGLYALGIAGVAGAPEAGGTAGRLRRALAGACFAGCLALVGFGIYVMLDK